MENKKEIKTNIVKDILNIIENAQKIALLDLNLVLIKRNWLIGKRINEEILTNRSADYGKQLIKNLSLILSNYGNGFKKSDLYLFVSFYKTYPNIFQTFGKSKKKKFLYWSFYTLLIMIKNDAEREWYETQALTNNWSFRILKRNIKTKMFDRISPIEIISSSKQKTLIDNYYKTIYVLDFLYLNEHEYNESDLEQKIINNLGNFLIELGSGYSFVGEQVRLRGLDTTYRVDLVFYNTILKRYLLIDLKVNEIKHSDIGQMTLYLELFDQQYKKETDNDSIGMILSSDLNGDIVKYLMAKTPNHIVASKYLTYLPTKEQLRKEIEKVRLALSKK